MIEKIAHVDPRKITDVNQLQEMLILVINVCDQLHTALEDMQVEVQSLKNEINVLKGEQETPKFPKRPTSKQPQPGTGPEKPSGKRGNHKRGGKKGRVKIDRTEMVVPDTSCLPDDAVLKEYKDYIQQDLRLQRDNVKYRVAIYYSPSQRRTYRAPMPANYHGAFGLGLISLTQLLSGGADVTQGRIEALYTSLGIEISSGTISHLITRQADWAVEEQGQILRQGIACSPFTQVDGTKSVERGKAMATQIICSDKFSVFLTMPGKSRLDVLAAIQGKPADGLRVSLNVASGNFMKLMAVSQSAQSLIPELLVEGQKLLLSELMIILNDPVHGFSEYNRVRIAHALALSHYQEQKDFPVIAWLLSDDAGEYAKIAGQGHALCWIHDARYYRKLIPRTDVHKKIHRKVLDEYWTFYNQLKEYRGLSGPEQVLKKESLIHDFDRIFKQETDYNQINSCLKRTCRNKDKLLAVLENPALPLHNNAAERGARRVVRKRDISLHTWSNQGTRVRDAFMTIVETAAKLGVNALEYIEDRVGGAKKMVSLADRITVNYMK